MLDNHRLWNQLIVAMSIHSKVKMTGSAEPITDLKTKTSCRITRPRELQPKFLGFKSNTMLSRTFT